MMLEEDLTRACLWDTLHDAHVSLEFTGGDAILTFQSDHLARYHNWSVPMFIRIESAKIKASAWNSESGLFSPISEWTLRGDVKDADTDTEQSLQIEVMELEDDGSESGRYLRFEFNGDTFTLEANGHAVTWSEFAELGALYWEAFAQRSEQLRKQANDNDSV